MSRTSSEQRNLGRSVDLIGQKFGRLVVLQCSDIRKSGHICWLCQCSCGERTIVTSSHLKNGITKSCGCLRVEKTKWRSAKHGHGGRGKQSATYISWSNMLRRCLNDNCLAYHNYGGRGIAVCEQWKSFPNFLRDMNEAPKGCQIDRIDNNKGYYKENCRWVAPKVNSRNRRNNHLLTYNGKTQCIVDWANECNIKRSTLWARLCLYGWSPEKALTTSVEKRRIR